MEIKTIKKIGKGNFAEVFLTKYRLPNSKKTEYLVKKVLYLQDPPSNVEKIQKSMLNNELKSLSKLEKHPNIVKMYNNEIFEDNHVDIFLEYCDGGDLKRIIEYNFHSSEDKTEKVTKFYVRQLKNALVFMNKMNIMHRDIKPENILLKRNPHWKYNDIYKWTIKLSDFGFSTTFRNGEEFNNEMCSYYYISPEMLAIKMSKTKYYEKYGWNNEIKMKILNKIISLFGKQVTHYDYKIDVWSFGIVVYEMLYGTVPFFNTFSGKEYLENEGRKKMDLKNVLVDMIFNLSDIYVTDYSVECKNLLARCLKINKNKRYSWTEIAEDPWFLEEPILTDDNDNTILEQSFKHQKKV